MQQSAPCAHIPVAVMTNMRNTGQLIVCCLPSTIIRIPAEHAVAFEMLERLLQTDMQLERCLCHAMPAVRLDVNAAALVVLLDMFQFDCAGQPLAPTAAGSSTAMCLQLRRKCLEIMQVLRATKQMRMAYMLLCHGPPGASGSGCYPFNRCRTDGCLNVGDPTNDRCTSCRGNGVSS